MDSQSPRLLDAKTTFIEQCYAAECVRKSVCVCVKEREIERDFYFLKVHLGDSNRQPQSSRENLG